MKPKGIVIGDIINHYVLEPILPFIFRFTDNCPVTIPVKIFTSFSAFDDIY